MSRLFIVKKQKENTTRTDQKVKSKKKNTHDIYHVIVEGSRKTRINSRLFIYFYDYYLSRFLDKLEITRKLMKQMKRRERNE